MKMLLRKAACALLLLICLPGLQKLKATHIVGAELYYECLNSSTNTYRFTLRMLRDCATGEAPFDDVVNLFIFPRANPSGYTIVPVPKPPVTPPVVNTGWSQCVSQSAQPCVEEGIYRTDITLPPGQGGYDVAWARCCRNADINNLFLPLDQGVTFLAHIPGPEHAVCNSMPTFDNQLPTFICRGEDFYFDHSATDPDGDSLVYQISWPYDGLTFTGLGAGNANPGSNSPTVDASNPMGPPPYRNVTYSSGFGFLSPFGPAPTASIDPVTGLLHFNAPSIGVYVVAISVLEYRNGILLSENKKDLQLHVLQCLPQNQPPAIQHVFAPSDSVSGDTLILQIGDTTCYQVVVTDPDNSQLNAQALSTFFSGPNAPSVHVSGTNPLLIDICWVPSCDFIGQDFELVIMGYDEENCPIYNPAFDTVHIRVLPPLNASPVLGHQLPASNPLGPDTLLLEVDSNACAALFIVDPTADSGPINYSLQVNDLSGSSNLNLGSTVTSSSPDSLLLELCLQGQCDNMEHLFQVILEGRLEGLCPPFDKGWDTLYVFVPALPNPAPIVQPNLSGQLLNNDTILVDVHDTLCFTVTVDDSFPALGFGLQAILEAVDGQGAGGFQPSVQVLSNADSLLAQVCWYPVCDNVERLFRIILTGRQDNRCDQNAFAQDTVYIRVRNVVNPPPVIGHSFDSLNYNFDGDTLIVAADSAACFYFSLSDQGGNTYLDLSHEVQLLGGTASGQNTTIQYSTQSDTLLQGEICFVPGCEFLGQNLMVALSGRDTFDCNNANRVFDTVYIRVVEPFNQPPTVSHDLSGLDVVAGQVNVVPNGQPYCYTVTVLDPDLLYADLTAEGVGNIFEDWYRYGNPASITTSGSNPMTVTICWNPSCYDAGESFGIVVCARDTSRCALTESVCDTVMFSVGDCSIQIGNVFSPNGDGINDVFEPFNVVGLEYYRLHIFDRWGRSIYSGENLGWNGGLNNDTGRQLPEGVYYFTVEHQLYSAKGVPLKQQEVGHVTLMR